MWIISIDTPLIYKTSVFKLKKKIWCKSKCMTEWYCVRSFQKYGKMTKEKLNSFWIQLIWNNVLDYMFSFLILRVQI